MKRRAAALLSRRNWRDTREYLRYYAEVLQNQPRSTEFARGALDHLLRWATATPFPGVARLRPTYPAYLAALAHSVEYERKLLNVARSFLADARERWPKRYAPLPRDFARTWRSKRRVGQVRARKLYSLAAVRQLLAYPATTRVARRDRAAVAFLFLSGMRVGAFVTLPMCAVHLLPRPALINQWPALGVHTKNGVAANTFLLDDPDLDDLRAIVCAWDAEVRASLGDQGMWYTLLAPDGETFAAQQIPGAHRAGGVGRRLRRLCALAGVAYRSPHKLRHGHIVWATARCASLADFKAVSQNVLHRQMATTDAIYARLTERDVAQRLAQLGRSAPEVDELVEALFGPLAREI